MKPNGQSTAQGLSSEIHPNKVGMIKKQQQSDEKVSIFPSVNTRSHLKAIGFKDDSYFLCNNPAAGRPESVNNTATYVTNVKVHKYMIVLNDTALLAKLKHSDMIVLKAIIGNFW